MESTQGTKRMTLVRKEDYEVDVEYNEDFFILHIPVVKKFSKTIYLDMEETLDDISTFAKVMGYPAVFAATLDDKTEKLVKKLGMVFQGSADGFNVYVLSTENV